MQDDLHELIAAWLGEKISEERRTALLHRLKEGAAFRSAFVTEARTFAMLKAVQSPEPRWLGLQDELGLSTTFGPNFEDRFNQALKIEKRPFVASWWRTAAALAACLAVAFAVLLVLRRAPQIEGEPFGVVVRATDVQWMSGAIAEGGNFGAGRLQIGKGRLTLAYLGGVSLHLEGPADVTLTSPDRLICRQGNLRAHVSEGREGFTIETPGAAVVDLGTEFGVRVDAAGRSQVTVYEGKAETALLSQDGTPSRTRLLGAKESVELDPESGSIRNIETLELLSAPEAVIDSLPVGKGYEALILKSSPLHYWRGNRLLGGTVADLGSGNRALNVSGNVEAKEDGSFWFGDSKEGGQMEMEGEWTPPEAFAIELWFATRTFRTSALAVLRSNSAPQGEMTLLELTSRDSQSPFSPGRVRFLYRWPPGGSGGLNLYSAPQYVPFRWHHLVCQRRGRALEMYLDGKWYGSTPLDGLEASTNCLLRLGKLREDPQARIRRQFRGWLAEIAVYDRALEKLEIQQHAQGLK